jgi:hypothetical protein
VARRGAGCSVFSTDHDARVGKIFDQVGEIAKRKKSRQLRTSNQTGCTDYCLLSLRVKKRRV